ncbi:TIM-barrel domain-containing protein [Streptomyces sp. NPDC006984]|uniref:TIM-barrel domain-containing protein n=1 Tax=Streptomyces sp. NPDC006984 TaxID=3155463 RepID=UPI0033CCB583
MDDRGLVRPVQWFGSWRGRREPSARGGPGTAAGASRGERARTPGAAVGAEPSDGGGVVRFARSSLRIVVTAGGAVFSGWDGAEPLPSHGLAGSPPERDPRAALEPDTDGGWRVVSERVTVAVSRLGAVEFRTPGGVVLRRELPPRWWEPVNGGPGRWLLRSEVAADARVFGWGGRAEGVRLREARLGWADGAAGGPSPLFGMPVELVVADAGTHLVFHDTARGGRVVVREGEEGAGSGHDRCGTVELRMDGGPLRSWLLVGGPARVLGGFVRLTGAPVLPPAWAFGRHHRFRCEWPVPEERVREAVAGCSARGVPLSAVHLGGSAAHLPQAPEASEASEASGGSARDAGAVPDAARLAKDLDGVGVRLVWAGAPDGGPEPAARGQGTGVPYGELSARGFAGVVRGPALRDGSGATVAEVTAVDAARAVREELQAACPEEPPFLATVEGWAGIQRAAAAWVVQDPVQEGWAGLRAALSAVLGLGLCGVPFTGLDVPEAAAPGGSPAGRWRRAAPGASPELALRRLELAAFLPMLRTSGQRAVPGPDGEAVLRERERLVPYLLSSARLARWTGAPMVRPLWWEHPGDRGLREGEDAFLLGDALLVAPVLEPGATRRAVRLPRGRWYSTATACPWEGPGEVVVEAPLGHVPVLARAGSVLPVRAPGGGTEWEVWAPVRGRTGGGLVARDTDGGPADPGIGRYATRWDGDRVVAEWRVGDQRVPVAGPLRVRGDG